MLSWHINTELTAAMLSQRWMLRMASVNSLVVVAVAAADRDMIRRAP